VRENTYRDAARERDEARQRHPDICGVWRHRGTGTLVHAEINPGDIVSCRRVDGRPARGGGGAMPVDEFRRNYVRQGP